MGTRGKNVSKNDLHDTQMWRKQTWKEIEGGGRENFGPKKKQQPKKKTNPNNPRCTVKKRRPFPVCPWARGTTLDARGVRGNRRGEKTRESINLKATGKRAQYGSPH